MESPKDLSAFPPSGGGIDGAVKDEQSITSDWLSRQPVIDGVQVREVRNVAKPRGGMLTEVFRLDWRLDSGRIEQVFQNVLEPGQISGWHAHRRTTDRIFVNWGLIKLVLFDARESSPTHTRINVFQFGLVRPALVIVPPGVWHAVQNVASTPSALLNLVDHAYCYEDPDHWRLPLDTPKIPYRFPTGSPWLHS
jgi:dTDP-4-dehydrorhamnose 3,5-epimerase